VSAMPTISGRLPFTPVEVSVYYAVRFSTLRQYGNEWRAPCPLHGGVRNNFAVNSKTGEWFCHSKCGRGGDIFKFLASTGADFKAAEGEVDRIIGRPEVSAKKAAGKNRLGPTIASYDYKDADGELLYQVCRHDPKDFTQRYPDGRGGWVWKKHPNQVLYRLREVLENPIIFICEGEKDCETLRDHGFVATTNAGGAVRRRAQRVRADRDARGHKCPLRSIPQRMSSTSRLAPRTKSRPAAPWCLERRRPAGVERFPTLDVDRGLHAVRWSFPDVWRSKEQ
jgi:CHC2 zinc finger